MRRMILFIASSLDGYIARSDDSFDWLFMDQDYGITAFMESIDTVLIGRRTHDIMVQMGDPVITGKLNIVFTHTPHDSDRSDLVFTDEDPVSVVTRLKQEQGQSIWLMGGGRIITPLIEAGLVDELVLSIHPIILGEGIPLFVDLSEHRLTLRDTKAWSTGLLTVTYEFLNAG